MLSASLKTLTPLFAALLATSLSAQTAAAPANGPQISPPGLDLFGGPLRIFGVDASPVGAASLSIDTLPGGKQALKISNLGSSGCDGVSIAPQGDGLEAMAFEIQPTSQTLPSESFAMAFSGSVSGGPAGPLGNASWRLTSDPVYGDVWALSFDSSDLGAVSHTLTLMDEGWRALTTQLADGDELVLSGPPQVVSYGINSQNPTIYPDFIVEISPPIKAVGILHQGGGYTNLDMQITRVQALVDIPTPPSLTLSAMELRSTDTTEVLVSDISQSFSGAVISGTDLALVEHVGGKLKVSNLGSSGCDGVSIDLGDGDGSGTSIDGASVEISPLSSGGNVPTGATFSVSIDATVQGEYHPGFAAIKATKGPPGAMDRIEFTCDPNLVNVIWFYEYRLAGQVVASGDPSAVQSFQVADYFDRFTQIEVGNGVQIGDMDGDGISEIAVGVPGLATVDGNVYQMDEIRLVIPSSDAWKVSSIDTFTLEASNLAEFSLTKVFDKAMPKLNLGHLHGHRGHVTILKEPLSVGGSLEAGSTSAVMLDDGPPNQPGILALSVDVNPTPFKGATLLPIPFLTILNIGTDISGGLDLPFVWPQGIPAGFQIYAQVATNDPSPNSAAWISNAVELVAQ